MHRNIIRLVIIVLLAAFAVFIHKNKQSLSDRYVIWRNPPAPAIVELADKTGMTALGRRIFFASTPSLDDAAELNENCSDIKTDMIVLGCYARGRIHVFNVRDKRIGDAKHVTAAHEMLHAAYARLSKNDTATIHRMLEEAYHQHAGGNDELRAIMDEYARNNPDQRYNELHSIAGTEFAGLYPELERYYARYFTDRLNIVDMAAQYRRVFTSLEIELDRLRVQITRLSQEIESDTYLVDSMVSWLNSDIDAFNASQFHSRSEFNSAREALIEREREINRLRAQINENILRYDGHVDEYNNLGGRINQLNYQIDSKSQTGIRAIKP